VVELAFEYEHSEFPKAEDILAVIGVESSFNPDSVSGLRRDPAVGLMQVRPGIWDIDPEHLEDIENQIKYGARILTQYYRRLGDKEAALQAYNLGITKFRRGGRNQRYVDKFTQVRNVVNRGAAGGI
jgi:soluble lytic murein transglycosylase-like protein